MIVNEKWLPLVKVALLIVVLAPLSGVPLGQQELVVWVAALVALVVLLVRSRRAGNRTRPRSHGTVD
jgi:hypothetical protein